MTSQEHVAKHALPAGRGAMLQGQCCVFPEPDPQYSYKTYGSAGVAFFPSAYTHLKPTSAYVIRAFLMRGIPPPQQSMEDFSAQLQFLDVVLGQVPTSPYQPCPCC